MRNLDQLKVAAIDAFARPLEHPAPVGKAEEVLKDVVAFILRTTHKPVTVIIHSAPGEPLRVLVSFTPEKERVNTSDQTYHHS